MIVLIVFFFFVFVCSDNAWLQARLHTWSPGGGNLSPNSWCLTQTHCSHSHTDCQRFATNWHVIYKQRQTINASQSVSAICLWRVTKHVCHFVVELPTSINKIIVCEGIWFFLFVYEILAELWMEVADVNFCLIRIFVHLHVTDMRILSIYHNKSVLLLIDSV